MLHFLEFLAEAAKKEGKLSFSDEHALAKMWNHGIDSGNYDHEHLQREIEKAKKDPEHPLSFETHVRNHGRAGFKKAKSPHEKEHYYKQLQNTSRVASDLGNHKDFAEARKKKMRASVAGATHGGNLSDTWKKHKATNRTSRADITIGNGHRRISLKMGEGSQLASMEPSQMMATFDHASRELSREDRTHNSGRHKELMDHVSKIAKHMNAMKGSKTEEERDGHLAKMQETFSTLTQKFPNVLHHVVKEAVSGNGQFGNDSHSTATHIVSYTKEKSKIKHVDKVDSSDYTKIRPAKGKGQTGKSGDANRQHRPGSLRIDAAKI